MIKLIFLALRRFYGRRRTLAALGTLDDRQLADIGLSRSDLLNVSVTGRLPGR